jgi:hypothetical protein
VNARIFDGVTAKTNATLAELLSKQDAVTNVEDPVELLEIHRMTSGDDQSSEHATYSADPGGAGTRPSRVLDGDRLGGRIAAGGAGWWLPGWVAPVGEGGYGADCGERGRGE